MSRSRLVRRASAVALSFCSVVWAAAASRTAKAASMVVAVTAVEGTA